MALLPIKHPQKDLFVLDIADVLPKAALASMEHPLFSLATKPDMRHLEYRSGDNMLRITPSGVGLPTIFDKDILIFVISQLMYQQNQGEKITIKIPEWAAEQAREIAREKGWDFYVMQDNWLAFAKEQTAQGNPPKNAGAAFVAYAKKQAKLR